MSNTKKLSIILGFWTVFWGFIGLCFWHPTALLILVIALSAFSLSVYLWNTLSDF